MNKSIKTIKNNLPITFWHITTDLRDKETSLRSADFPIYKSRLSVCINSPKPISKLLLINTNDQI